MSEGSILEFDSHGARLMAFDRGAGQLAIMLHGGLADHEAALHRFQPIDALRVVAPDLRGSGRSHDGGPLSWSQLAADVASLLDHLGVDRAVVGGISSGASVAVRFALDHGERLAGLVVVQPIHGGVALTEAQRAAFEAMDQLGRRAPVDGVGVLRPLFERLPEAVRAYALLKLEGLDARSVAATTELLARGLPPIAAPSALAAIRAPTLLAPGNDDLHPPAVSALFAEQIAGCRRVDRLDAPALLEFCRDAYASGAGGTGSTRPG